MLTPDFLRDRGIRAVLFDKDGTLIDSLGPWAAAEKAVSETLVARRAPALGGGGEELVSRMLASVGIVDGRVDRGGLLATGTSAALLAAMRGVMETGLGDSLDPEAFSSEVEGILADLYPRGGPEVRAMDGADRLLVTLKEAGFPLGIATSDDHDRTMEVLGRLGWVDHFVFFSCGDTASETKPSPWSVREFSRVASVPCSRIAVVGDTEVDRRMATAAGAGLFVLATDGFDGRQ